ncbi:hypothetical protein [Brevibacillus porteri]
MISFAMLVVAILSFPKKK